MKITNKSNKISKKRLLAFLGEHGIESKQVSFEAYGRQVSAYIYGLNGKRGEVERLLESVGGKVDREWCMRRGNCSADNFNVASITNVSFFKAYGWDI